MELPHLVPWHSTHMGLGVAPKAGKLAPELTMVDRVWREEVEVVVGDEVLRVLVGTTGEQLG